LLQWIDRWVARGFSIRRTIAGFPTYIFAPRDSRGTVEERLEAALQLLAATRPKWLNRLRGLVSAIEVGPIMTSAGAWVASRDSIVLNTDFVSNLRRPVLHIAAAIVHEGTHARIEHWKVPYRADTKIRIERACLQQERGFLLELPQDELRDWALARIDENYVNAEDIWSSSRAEASAAKALTDVGIPPRIAAVLMRIRKWRIGDDAV
jgi:hypothetical protein